MMTRPETAALNPETLLDRLEGDKYRHEAIRWNDCGDHYELVFTDNFVTPGSGRSEMGPGMPMPFRLPGSAILTDLVMDMKAGDRSKEVHVFVGSFGGEVAALSMVLQQLLTYEYRVGINLGVACSCGWMLLFACQERYVSPFSQNLYHDMSAASFGKHSEIRNQNCFMERWQQELDKVTDTSKVLTERERELGRTSEVWLTGQELIDRGAARDYSEYLTRPMPMPTGRLLMVNGKLYVASPAGYRRCEVVKDVPALSWSELRRELEAECRPTAEPEKKHGETADAAGNGDSETPAKKSAEKPAKRSRRKPAADAK